MKISFPLFPMTRFLDTGGNKLRTIFPHISVFSKAPPKPIWDISFVGGGVGSLYDIHCIEGWPAAQELITGNYFFIGGRFLEIRAPRRVTGPKSRGLHGKSMENPKKKEAILSKNDDFGKLSKFLENQKKTVKILKINWLYS